MKKILCLLLATLTALAVLGGCSQKDPTEDNPPKKPHSTLATADSATPDQATESGGKVLVKDSELGDIWINKVPGIAPNTLSAEGFTGDGSFLHYNENGVSAETGVDVSSFSGEIDWASVKNAGVDFAMIRLGGRGYGESGALYADETAAENIKGARAAGIKIGGYFYSQATTEEEAREEAAYCKEVLGDVIPDYPIAFDWEIVENENARTDNVDNKTVTACARAFCETVKGYGFKPMIYAYTRDLYFTYDLSELSDYAIWLREYNEVPTCYYSFDMWQYSREVTLDGIENTVDLNLCFIRDNTPA